MTAPNPRRGTDRLGPASSNLRGALFILASAFTFTTMTALVKFLGEGYSPALQTFWRQGAGLIVLSPLIFSRGLSAFRTDRPIALTLRSVGIVAAMTLSFVAYQHLPLAQANALSFTRALWMVPLAIVFLKERPSVLNLGASIVGFAGVLIMLGPLAQGATEILPVLAGLSAAALFALTVSGVKYLTRDNDPLTLIVWAAVMGTVFATPGALMSWRTPSLPDALLLGGMGIMGLATQGFFIKGMQAGDALAMAPIDYSRLLFAAVVGLVVFHEVPSLRAMLGAALIILSTGGMAMVQYVRARRESRAPALADPPGDIE